MKLGLIPKLIIAVIIGILLGFIAPGWLISITETGRVILSNLIQFFIPLIVFSFVGASIAEFGNRAGKLLGFTIGISYLDTLIACLVAVAAAFLIVPSFALQVQEAQEATAIAAPFIEIEIPPVMDIMTAIVLAIVIGIASTWGQSRVISSLVIELRDMINRVITGFVIPIIPFFILFIFVEIAAKGELFGTMTVFGKMLILIIVLQIIWLVLEYSTAALISKQNPFTVIKKMLPAYFTALSTMSSAATIPVSLAQAKKVPFIKNKIADFVMPLASNVHMPGSAMAITISAITVNLLTVGTLPPVVNIIAFVIILGVVEVGSVGVPGGSILAAIGILETQLGFGDVAIGLMLALFMIQDSFGTAANIHGDGAIAMIVNHYFGKDVNESDESTEVEV